MLDDIIEFLLELVLDGVMEAAGSKRVPMPIRIALLGVIAGIMLGVVGLLLWVGISSGSVLMIAIAVGLLIFFAVGGYFKIKKIRNKQ